MIISIIIALFVGAFTIDVTRNYLRNAITVGSLENDLRNATHIPGLLALAVIFSVSNIDAEPYADLANWLTSLRWIWVASLQWLRPLTLPKDSAFFLFLGLGGVAACLLAGSIASFLRLLDGAPSGAHATPAAVKVAAGAVMIWHVVNNPVTGYTRAALWNIGVFCIVTGIIRFALLVGFIRFGFDYLREKLKKEEKPYGNAIFPENVIDLDKIRKGLGK